MFILLPLLYVSLFHLDPLDTIIYVSMGDERINKITL